jgi:hypothetical protein
MASIVLNCGCDMCKPCCTAMARAALDLVKDVCCSNHPTHPLDAALCKRILPKKYLPWLKARREDAQLLRAHTCYCGKNARRCRCPKADPSHECPQCRLRYTPNGGCNNMTCPRCRHVWTRPELAPTPYNNSHGFPVSCGCGTFIATCGIVLCIYLAMRSPPPADWFSVAKIANAMCTNDRVCYEMTLSNNNINASIWLRMVDRSARLGGLERLYEAHRHQHFIVFHHANNGTHMRVIYLRDSLTRPIMYGSDCLGDACPLSTFDAEANRGFVIAQ